MATTQPNIGDSVTQRSRTLPSDPSATNNLVWAVFPYFQRQRVSPDDRGAGLITTAVNPVPRACFMRCSFGFSAYRNNISRLVPLLLEYRPDRINDLATRRAVALRQRFDVATRWPMTNINSDPAMIIITNFGTLDPDLVPDHIRNRGGIIYQAPTWDARQIENDVAFRNTLPMFKATICSAILIRTLLPRDYFDERSFWAGVRTKHLEPFRALKTIALRPGVLPPLSGVSDPSHFVARQIYFRRWKDDMDALSYVLEIVAARRARDPDKVYIISVRAIPVIDHNQHNLSDYVPYNPFALERMVRNTFTLIDQGVSEIDAVVVHEDGYSLLSEEFDRDHWEFHLLLMQQYLGVAAVPNTCWDDDWTASVDAVFYLSLDARPLRFRGPSK